MGQLLSCGQSDRNLQQARPVCLAPTQEMVGEEIWDRAKGGKTTVYATATWAERRERRICSPGGRWGMGLALPCNPNQTHLSPTVDQEALAPSLSGKGESRTLRSTDDEG